METYFAPAARASQSQLCSEIDLVSHNPVVSGLLHSVCGLLAVLDEHRQIVALNDSFLKTLGIDDPQEALGLRPGEALQCIYAKDEPHGCGTTKLCASCGAAIAIAASLAEDKPCEKICALARKNASDLALMVKAHPTRINDQRFILLFMQDITVQQQRAALERTFYHDVNNILGMLVGSSEILARHQNSDLARSIHQASLRLLKEVTMQRFLSQSDSGQYQLVLNETDTENVFRDLQTFFKNHPAAQGKKLAFQNSYPATRLRTDLSLLQRILSNMIINALEASPENGSVKIWFDQEDRAFCVWNAQPIPPDIAPRIFQRNFSTKNQAGRGIGTYSMKLFGQELLGGQVNFISSDENGTTFRFTLPPADTL